MVENQIEKNMEHEMETGIIGFVGFIWDNGDDDGNYYIVYWGCIGRMVKEMETTILGLGLRFIHKLW